MSQQTPSAIHPQASSLDLQPSSLNQGRAVALALVFLCTLFIVYGSWLPFTLSNTWYSHFGLTAAVGQLSGFAFWSTLLSALPATLLHLALPANWQSNSVDLATNVFLTVPLAFFAAAWFTKGQKVRLTGWQAVGIWWYCTFVAILVEVGQLLLQGRVASGSDVLAQSIGAVAGLWLWARTGALLWPLVTQLQQELRQGSLWYRLALLYAGLFLLYNLAPFDLSIQPQDLYDKWKAGLITLMPFQYPQLSWQLRAYAMLSDFVVWLPLAYTLYRACRPYQPVLWYLVCYALATELLQLLVLSRSTDSTDVLMALFAGMLVRLFQTKRVHKHDGASAGSVAGSFAGAVAGSFKGSVAKSAAGPADRAMWAWLWLGWSGLLTILFWFPFDFSIAHLRAQWQAGTQTLPLQPWLLQSWLTLPFSELMQGTVLTAITTMLQKFVLAAPLGLVLWHWQQGQHVVVRGVLWGLVLGQVLVLELGQRFLPGKVSTVTDIVLAWTAIVVAYQITKLLRRPQLQPEHHQAAQASTKAATQQHLQPAALWPAVPGLLKLCLHISATTLALFFASQLSAVPYNVRELLGQDNLWQTLSVTLALYWCIGAIPLWLQRQRWPGVLVLIGCLLLHSQILFWWLYLSVPLEVLQDLVGAAHWQVSPAIEMAGRFSALLLVLQMALLWLAIRQHPKRGPLRATWLLLAPLLLGVWHGIVVVWANTDNITELFAGGGTWLSSLVFWCWLFLLMICSEWLRQAIGLAVQAKREVDTEHTTVSTKGVVVKALLACLGLYGSLPLLSQAFARSIYKYQQEFSALQFLLSPDRQQYLPPAELAGRYYLAIVALLCLVHWLNAIAYLRWRTKSVTVNSYVNS